MSVRETVPVRKLLLMLFVAVLALAGCGGGSSSSTSSSSSSTTGTVLTPAPGGGVVTIPGPVEARHWSIQRAPAAAIARKCPKDAAVMGCAVGSVPNLHRGPGLAIPPVPLFPDVSVWQGAVGWGSVAQWQRSHGWQPTAVWKMGEYRVDSQARRNAAETLRLGFRRAGYWFVRNTGCSSEAGQIISEARAESLQTVVEDDEVPEARGYASCLTPALTAAGLRVIEYTSPGSNPDGSNPGVRYLWVAAYGPQHVPCIFGVCSVGELGRQTIVAWQLTDGVFGFVTNIPGIGKDDVSADYGMGSIMAGPAAAPKPPPAPPKPVGQLGVLLNQTFASPWGKLNERLTGAQFLGAYAHRAKYRAYLHGTLQGKLRFLAGRIYVVAVREHKGWRGSQRGSRFQYLIHDAERAGRA